MEDLTTLRIDLGINAQKIAQQVMIHNENIESQITKGIEKGLESIMSEDNFIDAVARATQNEVDKILRDTLVSWEFRKKISQKLQEKVECEIDKYSEGLANKLMETLSD